VFRAGLNIHLLVFSVVEQQITSHNYSAFLVFTTTGESYPKSLWLLASRRTCGLDLA